MLLDLAVKTALQEALIFGLIALIASTFAFKRGFYKVPQFLTQKLPISIYHVLGAFLVFLFAGSILPSTILFFFPLARESLTSIGFIQILSAISCFFFSGYFLFFSKKRFFKLSGKTAQETPQAHFSLIF